MLTQPSKLSIILQAGLLATAGGWGAATFLDHTRGHISRGSGTVRQAPAVAVQEEFRAPVVNPPPVVARAPEVKSRASTPGPVPRSQVTVGNGEHLAAKVHPAEVIPSPRIVRLSPYLCAIVDACPPGAPNCGTYDQGGITRALVNPFQCRREWWDAMTARELQAKVEGRPLPSDWRVIKIEFHDGRKITIPEVCP